MANPTPLEGKVITITGAASGIGYATARYLAARGATLSLSDIQEAQLNDAVKSIRTDFPDSKLHSSVVDVTQTDAVKAWINETKNVFGKLHGSVNNAGIIPKVPLPLHLLPSEDWSRVITTNLTGTFNCLSAELGCIEDGGSIVNVSSAAGLYAGANVGAYVASKHGIVGLSKTAAVENADRGVRVNCVCPGLVDTPLVRQHNDASDGALSSLANLPQLFKRLASADEIASLISYLLSDESRFVTKAAYSIDGGYIG